MALTNTVNEKERPDYIEGAEGKENKTKVGALALQNNKLHKLEIAVTNSAETKNLPFMVENGDLVSDNDVELVIKSEDNTPEQIAERIAKRNGGKSRNNNEDEPIH